MNQFQELWYEGEDQQFLCALINGERGLLMYLQDPDDIGLTSRDPSYSAQVGAELEFVLSNGQHDFYPLSWTLPVDEIYRVIAYFHLHQKPAPFITWLSSDLD